jgi:stearoyl-CoA desaturase (delta-9 desaturase)
VCTTTRYPRASHFSLSSCIAATQLHPSAAPPYPVSWRSSAPFIASHLLPLLVIFTGVTTRAVVLLVVLYFVRVFCITAGYHRLLSHRAFKTSRVVQFAFAFGGVTAVQKGPLWWAGWHRQHHRFTDTDRDPHSPQHGVWWSHVGWVLSGRYGPPDPDLIRDLSQYPELRFLDRHDWIGPWALAGACWLVAGWSGLVVGFFLSTVLVWHATFLVNSAAHLIGRRRYDTNDTSRNSATVALVTMGEGWHNNHHHHPSAARQGVRRWELDATFGVLRVMEKLHLVHDLRAPSTAKLEKGLISTGAPR